MKQIRINRASSWLRTVCHLLFFTAIAAHGEMVFMDNVTVSSNLTVDGVISFSRMSPAATNTIRSSQSKDTSYMLVDGSRPMMGVLDMGGKVILNASAIVVSNLSARLVIGHGLGLGIANSYPSAAGAIQTGRRMAGRMFIGTCPGALQMGQVTYADSSMVMDSFSFGAEQRGKADGNMRIASYANASIQAGYSQVGGDMTIDKFAYGAEQRGSASQGSMYIGTFAHGALQGGYVFGSGSMRIGNVSYGALQSGVASSGGRMTIADNGFGAAQLGSVSLGLATNSGKGSLQLFNITNAVTATMTGNASLGLGACMVSNDQAIVAGDGGVSHGNGSITATGSIHGRSLQIYDRATFGGGITCLTPQGNLSMGCFTNRTVL